MKKSDSNHHLHQILPSTAVKSAAQRLDFTVTGYAVLTNDPTDMKTHRAKQSINLLKRHMKNILCLVVVYGVLIKPGCSNRILENKRLVGRWIFCVILLKRMGEYWVLLSRIQQDCKLLR